MSIIYSASQVLLLGSITAIIASRLMEFGDSYAKEKLFEKNNSHNFSDKGKMVLTYITVTIILGFIPPELADWLFNSFPHPEIQSITFSIVLVWVVIHMEVDDWNIENISTNTYGELTVLISLLIFVLYLFI